MTSSEFRRLTGLSERQVYYWRSQGWLGLDVMESGSGNFCQYGQSHVEKALSLKAASRFIDRPLPEIASDLAQMRQGVAV